jgi:2,3-dihydroxy-p-cumate/2,3-dihydroxybenzoate 3,4-dioxygenase
MIDLKDIRYVRLGTRNVDAATDYAQKILGLELVRKENGAHYFRSDNRDHTLVYFEGDPRDHTIAFELATREELDAAASALSDAGYQVEAGGRDGAQQRCVEDFVNFKDPTGNSVDLILRPHHSGRRYFATRDAGINGFSHVGLRTSDPSRDERFWTQLTNARVSDRIGAAPLLRIDGVHHKIALFPSAAPGVQHINHQVDSVDDLMRSWYMLKEQGVKIVFGPGRHPTSGAMFLYFEGPDGMVYEYSTGVKVFTEEEMKVYQPRQFPFTPASFCMWGSRPDIPEFRN